MECWWLQWFPGALRGTKCSPYETDADAVSVNSGQHSTYSIAFSISCSALEGHFWLCSFDAKFSRRISTVAPHSHDFGNTNTRRNVPTGKTYDPALNNLVDSTIVDIYIMPRLRHIHNPNSLQHETPTCAELVEGGSKQRETYIVIFVASVSLHWHLSNLT